MAIKGLESFQVQVVPNGARKINILEEIQTWKQ